jgi:hypothetical protein
MYYDNKTAKKRFNGEALEISKFISENKAIYEIMKVSG